MKRLGRKTRFSRPGTRTHGHWCEMADTKNVQSGSNRMLVSKYVECILEKHPEEVAYVTDYSSISDAPPRESKESEAKLT